MLKSMVFLLIHIVKQFSLVEIRNMQCNILVLLNDSWEVIPQLTNPRGKRQCWKKICSDLIFINQARQSCLPLGIGKTEAPLSRVARRSGQTGPSFGRFIKYLNVLCFSTFHFLLPLNGFPNLRDPTSCFSPSPSSETDFVKIMFVNEYIEC